MKEITLISMHKILVNKWAPVTPLGPLYLIASLEQNGFSVDFRDYQFTDHKSYFDVDNLVRFLEGGSDIIGVSCMSNMLPFVILAAKRLKEKYPKKTIILGGTGPTSVANLIIKHFPFVDIVVRGEGEETIVELLNNLNSMKDINSVAGINFRKGRQIQFNPGRNRIEYLDNLPSPYKSSLDLTCYKRKCILTGRGCAYNCIFCAIPRLCGRRVCFRSIDEVIKEIKLIYEQDSNDFKISLNDDTFVLKKERVLEFCRKLKKLNLIEPKWTCNARIDLMDEELMQAMSESGCFSVCYGVESGSDRILRRLNKGFSSQDVVKIITKSKKYFTDMKVNFIWGFPFETMQDFYDSVLIFLFLRAEGISCWVRLAAPLASSGLYEQYKNRLRFSEELISSIAWARLPGLSLDKEIVGLIKRYPNIFPDFYYFDSKDIFKKKQRIERIIYSSGKKKEEDYRNG